MASPIPSTSVDEFDATKLSFREESAEEKLFKTKNGFGGNGKATQYPSVYDYGIPANPAKPFGCIVTVKDVYFPYGIGKVYQDPSKPPQPGYTASIGFNGIRRKAAGVFEFPPPPRPEVNMDQMNKLFELGDKTDETFKVALVSLEKEPDGVIQHKAVRTAKGKVDLFFHCDLKHNPKDPTDIQTALIGPNGERLTLEQAMKISKGAVARVEIHIKNGYCTAPPIGGVKRVYTVIWIKHPGSDPSSKNEKEVDLSRLGASPDIIENYKKRLRMVEDSIEFAQLAEQTENDALKAKQEVVEEEEEEQ